MGRSMWKDILRQIKNTPRRFFAILLIVALGAAFFAGVKATSPDMKLTVDRYFDDYRAADIRLLSTMGFDGGDLDAIRGVDGIRTMQPAYSADGFLANGDNRQLVNFQSLDREAAADGTALNAPVLMEGRLPEAADECLIDEQLMTSGAYRIGDTVEIATEDDEGITDSISRLRYTIVGSARSTYYISLERGSSAKGTGSVSGFVLLPKENFCLSVYTDVYLTASDTVGMSRFSDSYSDTIDDLCDRLEAGGDQRNPQRLKELQDEADEKLADARQQVADGERELNENEQELKDAWQEWEDSRRQLDDGQAEYDREMANGQRKLDDAEKTLAAAEQELNDKRKQLDEGRAALDEGLSALEDVYKRQRWKRS